MAPVHDLDVGSNLYVDDAGSNVLHVTGNVYATRFVGDGAFLENIASNLHEITTNGNVTTNTVQFDGSTSLVTTGKVGISNTAPIHDLDVGSNLYVDDQGSNVLHVTGNIYATRFIGDNAVIENIIASTSVGIANTAPVHDLDVGSNLYVDDQGSNVLHVTGNVYATRFVGDGAFLENIASNLHEITTNGNVTTNTVLLQGSTALVSTGNVGIANTAPVHDLDVGSNLYVDDTGSNVLHVTGNVYATWFIGDNAVIENIIATTSVGIANTAPVHDLDVGSNLYVDDQGSNVLHVTGNVYATRFIGDGAFLENIASNLHEITTNGNVTTNTMQFDGSTSLVTTGKVGVSNTTPIHDLDVGSNLYVDDTGSNVLHVTGNVYATRFVGDGAFLENIASNLHEITTNGNVTTNTVQFDGSTSLVTTGKVGVSNTAPIHDLDVGSNLYVDDTGSNVLHVTGNVYATRFIGDGAFLENIASNLHEITTNGNVTTNTVLLEGSTALVTTGKVGVSNTTPIHDLDVGSNLYVDDTGSNVLHVTGNVYATRFVGDGAFLENIASNLHEITTNGNVTTNTVLLEGSTALVTTGKVGVANAAPEHELSVTGNAYVSSEINVVGGLITNLGGLTKKTYGYSGGTISASSTPEINVVFDSQLFSAKITAHLVEPTSNISVLNLDVTGGTGRNIGKGFLSIVGDQNSKHWDSTVTTTDTTVSLTPSVGLLSEGSYGVHVEYTSPLGTGGVTSIDKNGTSEIVFDY
jgi:ribonuclease PH